MRGRLYKGGMITERCWKVTWYEGRVEVVLSGGGAAGTDSYFIFSIKNGS